MAASVGRASSGRMCREAHAGVAALTVEATMEAGALTAKEIRRLEETAKEFWQIWRRRRRDY